MTKEEALDIAAKAAGWENWWLCRTTALAGVRTSVRAHADTLLREAELIERFDEYKWEVSEAVDQWKRVCHIALSPDFDRFIIPTPDPLEEAIAEYRRTPGSGEYCTPEQRADALRAALAKNGLKLERLDQ